MQSPLHQPLLLDHSAASHPPGRCPTSPGAAHFSGQKARNTQDRAWARVHVPGRRRGVGLSPHARCQCQYAPNSADAPSAAQGGWGQPQPQSRAEGYPAIPPLARCAHRTLHVPRAARAAGATAPTPGISASLLRAEHKPPIKLIMQ